MLSVAGVFVQWDSLFKSNNSVLNTESVFNDTFESTALPGGGGGGGVRFVVISSSHRTQTLATTIEIES